LAALKKAIQSLGYAFASVFGTAQVDCDIKIRGPGEKEEEAL
jgi:hypothetical protein